MFVNDKNNKTLTTSKKGKVKRIWDATYAAGVTDQKGGCKGEYSCI